MSIFRTPIIAKCDNDDGTQGIAAGSTFPFNMRIECDDEAMVVPAERDEYGYYYAEATLPSNADVRVTR